MAATRKLNIIICAWTLSIIMVAVNGMAQELPNPTQAMQVLGSGTTQGVLSVVIMGLTVAFVWVARKLLASKDELAASKDKQLEDQKAIFTEVVTKNSELIQADIDSKKALISSFHRFADVIQECPGAESLTTSDLELPDTAT